MKHWIVFLLFFALVLTEVDAQKVVVNEIMYNPDGNNVEWVELYNRSEEPVDISGWYIIDQDSNHHPAILPQNTVLEEGGFFTVVVDGGPYIPFDPGVVETGLFGLSNGGDEVNLFTSQQQVIDHVTYQDQEPWPSLADGDGYTLELKNAAADNNDPDEWAASRVYGGTPNGQNSLLITYPYAQLIYPNGTEQLEKGKTYSVKWESLNYSGAMTLKLVSLDNNYDEVLATGLDAAGFYEWTVKTSIPYGDDYYMRINGEGDNPWDVSDRTFKVMPLQDMASIVITEIMYNPPGPGADSLEYLEIYNNESTAVNMKDYFFSDGIDYIFPDMQFPPKSYLLLAKDAETISAVTGKEVIQWSDGGLNNGGETLEIKNNYDGIVDRVSYDDRFPWDTLPDGYGTSLALCETLSDNALPGNWNASTKRFYTLMEGTPLYGTPGEKCHFSEVVDVSEKIDARVYPNPVKDRLTVEVERGRYEANVYTIMGERVRENNLRGKKLELEFSELEPGMYVVELINRKQPNQREYYKIQHI